MNVQKFLERMKKVQDKLLDYLEDESNGDEQFQSLMQVLEEIEIHKDEHLLMSLLHLLVKVANNHYRDPNFFEKIEKILQIFQEDIKKYYSNTEIFNIFKSNKQLLLFLIEHKLMVIDEYVAKKIIQKKYVKSNYLQYFLPEMRPFKDEKWIQPCHNDLSDKMFDELQKGELPDNFYENRKKGENENLICKFIREDSVQEFIAYVNKNNILLNSEIKSSIYETSPFLIKKQIESQPNIANLIMKKKDNKLTLIKYATFFGSIQIVQYLLMNNVELTPSLWLFAIHGKNAEIIQLLEDNHIIPMAKKNDQSSNKKDDVDIYAECFEESIKCHHNEIASYIQDNLIKKGNLQDSFIHSLKNYNFSFIQGDLINETSFYKICQYGYYLTAYNLIKEYNIDINNIFI